MNIMSKKAALHAFLLAGAVTLVGATFAVAGPAHAAKGGKSGDKSHQHIGSDTTACSAAQESVAPGETYTVQGAGFGVGQNLTIRVTTDRGSAYFGAWADASGSFTHQGQVGYATPVQVDVLDGLSWSLLASCSFKVV